MSKKIVIAGAGIGGLCAALALAKNKFEVTVYERNPQVGEVGAGIQLSPNAMHVLQALGIADEVKAKAFSPDAAVMRHYKTGKPYFTVPLGDNARQKYGADYLHVHRADLHTALYNACINMKVTIYLGKSIQNYQQTRKNITIQFDNNDSIEADLLIGADGIKSNIQACMLGKKPAEFTGQVAWRGVVEASKLPKGLIKPNANLWVGPGKHFVSYYLRGGDLINFIAVQERKNWQKESWNEPGDINELRETFSDWHPEVIKLLNATEQCFLWALFDRKPLEKWSDRKVTLLGDACHPMLPFLAQGAAMAIEDSYALAHCLSRDANIENALQSYQNIRLPRTRNIQLNARKNAALYHMSSPIEQAKLALVSGLSRIGLSDRIAANKLDAIYAYNIVEQLSMGPVSMGSES
ncbi:FAD-dependent monooxygenase [Colwellia sp. MB3u-70]|uniref:FAD-dependent monooxygenase n=1 Tax=unclassified Colwellia TaxID=196834 RepID=UPI0015F3F2BC|nr:MULTISPECIES: FAD-dependent monooxygenase [unclassified Colwellia]MBA6292250.1 FAD-dependent monooxygenase [Colwellia sp. MB3u-8]MBA6305756.1 FAD-dependent monooxygenase [Colwellia sp. MB3u-70]